MSIHGKSRETFIVFTIFKKFLKKTQSHETLRSWGKISCLEKLADKK